MKGAPTRGKRVDVDRCLELYNSGLSMAEVGRLMGHHHGVISYHLIRNGVKRKTYAEIRRIKIPSQKIADMYTTGMSAVEVAKELGITYQCVYDRLAEVGIKTRSRREQIKMMIKRGNYGWVRKGPSCKNWNGGFTNDKKGYRHARVDGHYICEHRMVWEKQNGAIPKNWVIHHLNGIKDDNRIENLVALPRKHHSPKSITDPYKKRIKELELKIKNLESQRKLF